MKISKTIRIIQFCLLFIMLSCNNNKGKISEVILKNDRGEDEIAILQNYPLQSGTTFYPLTHQDIKLIEQILKKEVDSLQNIPDISRTKKLENLGNYIRQYLGYQNADGDNEVFILCVSKERKYPMWREELILTIGGGNAVFKGAINLSKKKSLGFSINEPL